MDTFIRIICIYRDGCEDDTEPNTEEVTTTLRHETQEQVYDTIDHMMMNIVRMNGVLTPKEKGKGVRTKGDVNDLKYVPMHMFARFEFKTKALSVPTPEPAHLLDIPPAKGFFGGSSSGGALLQ